MLSLSRPIDLIGIALAVALGLLALTQWREASRFSQASVPATGEIVELREEKEVLFEATAAVYATVEFETEAGETVRAEIPTPLQRIDELDVATAVGRRVPISYDPDRVRQVRYGRSSGGESALVLALLAVGALFAPVALRNSALRRLAGGGGGG